MSKWLEFLNRPVDGASLAAYRVLFGALMAISTLRFWWMGWIERSFLEPQVFLKYWGFAWVPVPSASLVYILFAVLFLSSVSIMLGLFGRIARIVFLLSFLWIEFMDASNYLNHYYLVSLLGVINLFLPLNSMWSLDAKLGWVKESEIIPFWAIAILRFQFCVVYFFAGMAKATPDWLLHAQPMSLWMSSNDGLPLIGFLFKYNLVHYLAAWAGFLYDTFIWIFLLWAPSRPFAYLFVLGFHGMTHLMFPIGLFPFLMGVGTLIFFSPSWPRWWVQKTHSSVPVLQRTEPISEIPARMGRLGLALVMLYASVQILLPLRNHVLYSGNVLWSEEGMRWSWRVMAREKNGAVDFRVFDLKSGREWLIPTSEVLARHQELEMSGQPELILQVAHLIRKDFETRGHQVQVFAEAWVSLNGRPSAMMIDPQVDLSREVDHWLPKKWILPSPEDATELVGRW